MSLMRKRKRGERKNSGWTMRKDTKNYKKIGVRRELKKRKREEEAKKFEDEFAIADVCENGNTNERKKSLFRRLEHLLSEVKSKQNYGPRKAKNLMVDFSAVIGFTANTRGLKCFESPHPQTERYYLGICQTDPEEKRSNYWLREIWRLSKLLIPLYDPNFGESNFFLIFIFILYLIEI